MGRIWLVSGHPGVGKSTVVSKVVLRLKSAGVIVGGLLTQEKKEKGARVGFEVVDLTDGGRGELATIDSHLGPKIGRYRVNLADLARIGAAGLSKAASVSELIVIDEVGPMELVSPEFRKAVRTCIDSGKPVFAVIHGKLEDDLITELKEKAETSIALTEENRDEAADELSDLILAAVGGPKTA
jgi:nucleoside-triphosphatase